MQRSPRWQRTLHHRGLKNWRSTPGQSGGARKKAKKAKKPSTQLKACPSLLRTEMSTNSGDELSLRHLHCSRDNVSLHDRGNVHNRRTAPAAPRRPASQGHRLPVKKYCNCGTFAVFCTLNHPASVVAHNKHATTTSMQRFSQRAATVGISTVFSQTAPEDTAGPAHQTSNTISMDCNWRIPAVQGKRPLRHDSVVNDTRVTNTMQLRDRDCHLHNLHLWSCTTGTTETKNPCRTATVESP